jgi:hypothetical protein
VHKLLTKDNIKDKNQAAISRRESFEHQRHPLQQPIPHFAEQLHSIQFRILRDKYRILKGNTPSSLYD